MKEEFGHFTYTQYEKNKTNNSLILVALLVFEIIIGVLIFISEHPWVFLALFLLALFIFLIKPSKKEDPEFKLIDQRRAELQNQLPPSMIAIFHRQINAE